MLAGSCCACGLTLHLLRRRQGSWLRLSMHSTRKRLPGKPSGALQSKLSSKSEDPLLDAGKLPQLTFGGRDELGTGPHARQHAAFVAKRTGPFYLSPRCTP